MYTHIYIYIHMMYKNWHSSGGRMPGWSNENDLSWCLGFSYPEAISGHPFLNLLPSLSGYQTTNCWDNWKLRYWVCTRIIGGWSKPNPLTISCQIGQLGIHKYVICISSWTTKQLGSRCNRQAHQHPPPKKTKKGSSNFLKYWNSMWEKHDHFRVDQSDTYRCYMLGGWWLQPLPPTKVASAK